MRGYIERIDFEKDTINGWIHNPLDDDGESISITASLDDAEIGQTKPFGTRNDLFEKVSECPNILFELKLSRSITAHEILAHRFVVRATSQGTQKSVPMTMPLMERVIQRTDKKFQLGSEQPNRQPASTIPHSVNSALRGHLSPVLLPVGMESNDKSAKVGLLGNLFLTGGTNEIAKNYSVPDSDLIRKSSNEWKSLLDSRNDQCKQLGIRYIQTIVPDKLTTLRHLAPIKIDGPTPLLSATEDSVSGTPYYFSSIQELDHWELTEPPFITSDSHISATGAQRIFASLLRKFSPELTGLVESVVIDSPRYDIGDLSRRFYNLPIYSKSLEPSSADILKYSSGVQQVINLPARQGHIGTEYSWVNPAAPVKTKVLVFGSSTFGHGILPRELSWWGKLFFSEFHFIWGQEFDWTRISELAPDLVIGQTVERFIHVVPKS